MSAEVVARLRLDAESFREGIRQAQTGFGKLKSGLQSHASSWTATLVPVAKAMKTIGIAAGAAGAATGVALAAAMKSGVALNSELEQASLRFTSFTKSASESKAIIESLREESAKTPFSFRDMTEGAAALISSARGSREELDKMLKTAQILVALNPAKTFADAAFSIREAMGGDYVSVQSQFDISRSLINRMRAEGKEGLDVINESLKQMGAGPELVATLATSFSALQTKTWDTFENIKQVASEPLFNVLKANLEDFVKYMDSGAKQDILNFAKEFGEGFGETAKEVFQTIKSIDWVAMGQSAKGVADIISATAQFGATAISAAPQMWSDVLQGKDHVKGFGLAISENIARLTGDEKYAEEIAREREATRKRIEGRREDREASQTRFSNEVRSESNRAITTSEVIDNWLRTRGTNREDALKNPAMRQELLNRFGQEAMFGSATIGEASPIRQTQAAHHVRQTTGRAPLPVEILMAERNPIHTAMAT